MHILQLLPSLDVGGVERGVVDLAKGLIARGHRVSVVSSGGALVRRLTELGATHHVLPVHRKSPLALASCVAPLARLIQETGVDVVHARSRMPAWVGWLAARRAQRPFVTTAHGFYRPHPASRVMAWGRAVIAPSEALARYLVEEFRVPKGRLRVIPRGVDLDEFAWQPPRSPAGGPWRIGLFGRFSSIKGHEIAFEACAQLLRGGVPVHLCLAGEPRESARGRQLQRLAASLGLEGAVEWRGVEADLARVIASVDVVIVPSRYPESFGRAVIEAQAVGRPVIASRVGALPELIEDGATGLLVPPGDPTALAAALRRLLEDAELRARCAAAGRRAVEERWSLERMVEQTLAVYEECLTRPRILIWKLSALGDVILSSPSLRAIRRQYPRAHISLAVGRSSYEVVARCPYLDDVLLIDPAGAGRPLAQSWALVRRLRQEAFDLSVDLQNSRRTHLLAWLARIPVRVGYRRKFGWLLNRGVRLPRVVLAPIAHQHYLLRQAGFSTDGDTLEVWPSADDEQAVQRLLPRLLARSQAPLVGLHPGGSLRWKTKRWELDRWAGLCDALAERGVAVVLTGGPDEEAAGAALLARARSKPLNAIGRTSVLELACLIKRCRVVVTLDSSPLHLAAAVGTPVVALFGPTDPRRHLPSNFVGRVLVKPVFCSPCYSPRCRTITHACMRRIAVEEVLGAVLDLLASDARSAAPSGALRLPEPG